MGSQRNDKDRLGRSEAMWLLAEECRHLAQTCVTKEASRMLRRLADDLDRQKAGQDLSGIVSRKLRLSPAG